jgi:hypothetical protein
MERIKEFKTGKYLEAVIYRQNKNFETGAR